MNRSQVNRDFDNLVKYNINNGILKCEDNDYKLLLEWGKKNDPTLNPYVKKTDYGFYIVTFIIISVIIIILLMLYFTETKTEDIITDLLDENNKSSYIKIDEYDNEELE